MSNLSTKGQPQRPLLPVTIVPGMEVYDAAEGPAGHVVAITQAYCLYRPAESEGLCVAHWRDVALGNVCPADPLLPADVGENDVRNAAATAIRELLALQQVTDLTPAQSEALVELTKLLCSA
jgi:hypothetical protein